VKTLADRDVREFLSREFILALHNQVPELYCNTSVDPGVDRYPGDQVDGCPESAGGGNLRFFLCRPSGELLFEMLGYWKPDRFLDELRRGLAISAAGASASDVTRLHRACQARHESSGRREEKLLLRAHQEALSDLFKPVRGILDRIEDEVYTRGAIG
jgi:hypothetical protein